MNVDECINFQWSIKRNRVWEHESIYFRLRFAGTAPYDCFQETNRRAVFIWFRLMLPRVNSEHNRVTRKQLFLVYKIERSHPLARSGYNIIERERRKTIEEDPTITTFPRRDPEPQEDEIFPLFLFISLVLSRFIILAQCIALSVFSSVLKREHLWHRVLFSQGGSNLKGNLCVRKNDHDYR